MQASLARRMLSELGRSVVALSMLSSYACQHVPPAPIDPAANGERLLRRSLDDPAVAVALQAYDQPIPDEGRWSLDQLTIAAWALRTDIAVARAEIDTAAAATRLAYRRPNPSIATTFERVTNAGEGVKPWVIGASAGFLVETAGKRDIRLQRGLAQEEALQWQLAQTLWDARAEVGNALLQRLYADRTLMLDEQELSLRRAYLEWIETRLSYGAASTQDRLVASEALSELESRRELDRAALSGATAGLAAAVGVAPAGLASVTPVYPSMDALPDFGTQDLLAAREMALSNRLDVRRALAEYELAEQDLRAAVAAQYPDIALGPGYLVDQADRKITLSLGLPTVLSSRSAAAIDNAVASRALAASRFDAAQGIALAEIGTSFARYEAMRGAMAAARSAEEEAADRWRVAVRRLDAGATDRGEVVAAEIALSVRRRTTLDTWWALTQAIAALQDSIQRPIYPASSIPVAGPTEGAR